MFSRSYSFLVSLLILALVSCFPQLVGAGAHNKTRSLSYHTFFEQIRSDLVETSNRDHANCKMYGISPNIYVLRHGNYVRYAIGVADTFVTPSWNKERRFKFSFHSAGHPTASSYDFYVVTGYVGPAGSVDRHVGFRVSRGAVYGTVGNGFSQTTVDLVTILNDTYRHIFEAAYTPGVRAKFYIDGILKGKIAAGLPFNYTHAEQMLTLLLKHTDAANPTRDVQFFFGEFDFVQEP